MTQRSCTTTRSASPPPADEAEDAVAGLPARPRSPAGLDRSGHLEARDVGRGAGRRGIAPGPLLEVGGIQPREAHLDENVLVAGSRIGPVLEPDDLVAAGAGEDDSPHPTSSLSTREAPAEPLSLVGDVGAVVEPLDGEVEVTPGETARERRRQRGQVCDTLSRIAIQHLETAAMVPVVRRQRAEHVVLDVAGPRERRELLDHGDGVVERRDRVDQVEEDADRARPDLLHDRRGTRRR